MVRWWIVAFFPSVIEQYQAVGSEAADVNDTCMAITVKWCPDLCISCYHFDFSENTRGSYWAIARAAWYLYGHCCVPINMGNVKIDDLNLQVYINQWVYHVKPVSVSNGPNLDSVAVDMEKGTAFMTLTWPLLCKLVVSLHHNYESIRCR